VDKEEFRELLKGVVESNRLLFEKEKWSFFAPKLIIFTNNEGEKQAIFALLEEFPDDKHEFLASIGAKFRKDFPKAELEAVFLSCEAWTWKTKPGEHEDWKERLPSEEEIRELKQTAERVEVVVTSGLSVENETTGAIQEIVRDTFSFKPANMIKTLKLTRPIFKKTACYGHFGRNDPDFTWEKTDMAEVLKDKAGL
jgi:hypothetical protein